MAKWSGKVGFITSVESEPGIWTNTTIERSYRGESLSLSRRLAGPEQVNDSISISNQISIVADPYAFENFTSIRYATFMGTRWKISDVKVEFPHLIFTLGGIYNGN